MHKLANQLINLGNSVPSLRPHLAAILDTISKEANPSYKFVGDRYDKNLSPKDIAKFVRAELRSKFPGFKFSITSTYNKISVTIKGVPRGFQVHSNEYLNHLADFGPDVNFGRSARAYYTPAYSNLLETIKAYINSYNFDDSESMTDYFHSNFYVFVQMDFMLEREILNKELEDFR